MFSEAEARTQEIVAAPPAPKSKAMSMKKSVLRLIIKGIVLLFYDA